MGPNCFLTYVHTDKPELSAGSFFILVNIIQTSFGGMIYNEQKK